MRARVCEFLILADDHLLYNRKFSSAKNFVKNDRQAVRQEFIFVKRRSFGRRSFAFRFSSHSRIFVAHTFGFVKNLSQEFNLVKKLVLTKATKMSCYTVINIIFSFFFFFFFCFSYKKQKSGTNNASSREGILSSIVPFFRSVSLSLFILNQVNPSAIGLYDQQHLRLDVLQCP